MKKCKCGNECAGNAKSCPKCGYRFTSSLTKLILFLFGAIILVGAFGSHSSTSSNPTASSPAPVDSKEVLLRSVKLDYRWSKDGFGNVMVVDFTITNPTAIRFKDFEIKCRHFSSSGTEIDSNTRTIYEIVEPKAKKVVKNMNMGFIHSQAKSSSCVITDLTPL